MHTTTYRSASFPSACKLDTTSLDMSGSLDFEAAFEGWPVEEVTELLFEVVGLCLEEETAKVLAL